MNVEYINPFIQAAESVIQMVCGVNIEFKKAYLKSSPFVFKEIVIIIGIIGRIKGQVFFEMDEETAMKIASIMMGGMEVKELDEISKSAISEIGNMIMGNVSTVFSNNSINIDITPPALITGSGIEMSNKLATIVVPLNLQGVGTVNMNINIDDNPY